MVIAAIAVPFTNARPAEWTRVTETTDANIQEPALARTGDGVLHVVWIRKNGTKQDLLHTAIAPDGKAPAAPALVLEAWETLNNPDLVLTKDGGLRLFISGQRTIDIKDPHSQGVFFIQRVIKLMPSAKKHREERGWFQNTRWEKAVSCIEVIL